MKTDLFQSCGHCWVFQICWHVECSTFTASSSRIWNISSGIPSPPLALFIVTNHFLSSKTPQVGIYSHQNSHYRKKYTHTHTHTHTYINGWWASPGVHFICIMDFPGGSDDKESAHSREIWVWSLDQEDPLEKGKAAHPSFLAWRIPWSEEPGRLYSMGSQWVRHDWVTNTYTHLYIGLAKMFIWVFPWK